jgi:hypothetical protein
MRKLVPVALVLALAATSRAGDTAPVVSRDWERFPAVLELQTKGDVLAVGDVHGDDERFLRLLAAAKVIPKLAPPDELTWAAGKGVLVLTGDMIDKGPHSIAVLRAVRRLETVAATAGGRVVALLGNHEVEFLAGEKDAGLVKELETAKISPASVRSGEDELGAWLRTRPLAARVNDWFFAHAGNTDFRSVVELERGLRAGIEKEGFAARELLRADSLVEARLKPAPWWEVAGERPEATLDRMLSALGCKHLVIGHQPGHVKFSDRTSREKGELFQKYGRVFLIDTGMSRGVGDSEGALLWIHGAEARAVKPDGSERVIWKD